MAAFIEGLPYSGFVLSYNAVDLCNDIGLIGLFGKHFCMEWGVINLTKFSNGLSIYSGKRVAVSVCLGTRHSVADIGSPSKRD